MKTISLKLPEEMDAMLEAIAEERGKTKSEIVREALVAFFENGQKKPAVSAYDLAKELIGKFRGPRDLSTSRKYMRGYRR